MLPSLKGSSVMKKALFAFILIGLIGYLVIHSSKTAKHSMTENFSVLDRL